VEFLVITMGSTSNYAKKYIKNTNGQNRKNSTTWNPAEMLWSTEHGAPRTEHRAPSTYKTGTYNIVYTVNG
jgi:hypothetical protein